MTSDELRRLYKAFMNAEQALGDPEPKENQELLNWIAVNASAICDLMDSCEWLKDRYGGCFPKIEHALAKLKGVG